MKTSGQILNNLPQMSNNVDGWHSGFNKTVESHHLIIVQIVRHLLLNYLIINRSSTVCYISLNVASHNICMSCLKRTNAINDLPGTGQTGTNNNVTEMPVTELIATK